MTKKFDKASGKTSPKISRGLSTAIMIISKIAAIAHWVGVVGMVVLAIFGFSHGEWLKSAVEMGNTNNLNVYGFDTQIATDAGIDYTALGWFAIGAALILFCMGMVFQNIHHITKDSRETTPFTTDNMRMLKETGILFIATPVIGLIFSVIIILTTGAETSVGFGAVVAGLVMLYLTQLFAHGVELEDDVKGLV